MVGPLDPADPASPHWYAVPQTRSLILPARCGTSPWAPGGVPVRPLWPLWHLSRDWELRYTMGVALRTGAVPPTQAPVIDARLLTLSHAGTRLPYAWLRGIVRPWLRHGVRPPAMVTWAPPTGRAVGRGASLGALWTARVMPALWIVPALHPHSRTVGTPQDWLDSWRRWYDPWVGYDSGLVLDVRHLATMGVPLPLPDRLADAYRPHVRCLCLADVPLAPSDPPCSRPWLGDAPVLPQSSPRYTPQRWQAFVAQFPDVPVYVPAATQVAQVPLWLATMVPPYVRAPPVPCVRPPAPMVPPPRRPVRVPHLRRRPMLVA